MKLDRRLFMWFGAGAAAGAALGLPTGRLIGELASSMESEVRPPGGPERHVLSVCDLCPGGCGVRVRCVGDRPVKLEGNPLHPVSAGRLCPRGQAALQSLFHPDRIAGPLRREGPRGSLASFRPVTWKEALEDVGLRLALLRKRQRPESLALVHGPSSGLGMGLAARFAEAFGTPNVFELARGHEAARLAVMLAQGVHAAPVYDVAAADTVMSFGSSLLEAWDSPVYAMRAFGDLRRRQGRRGRLVHAGPRFSQTAASADEWVQLRPGTEGILALGIAGVLVSEDLYDQEFVRRRVHQFESWVDEEGEPCEGLRSLLQREFSLERVSLETGLSVNRILQLARQLAAGRPALAIGPRGGLLLSGNLFDHLAVHALNALLGNVEGPGGVLLPETVPLPGWPALEVDSVAERGRLQPRLGSRGAPGMGAARSDVEGLAEAILARSPYEVEALLILDADPAFACMAPDAFASALELVPLVVTFASIPSETALASDWILPPSHFLERWDLHSTPPGLPYPMASLAAPALDQPLADTLPLGELVLALSAEIGGPLATALPWRDQKSLIRAQIDGLFETRRGAIVGTAFDEAWVRLMERAGWWVPGYRSREELWDRMGEAGGWWDPFYDHGDWQRVLRTPSRRIELRPRELAEILQGRRRRPQELHRKSAADADESLELLLFEPLAFAGGTGAELPFLQDVADPGPEQRWETWVEVHPRSAARLAIADGATVRVVSSHGAIQARARVNTRVVEGVAAIPIGLGRRGGGRWAVGVGANPLRLLGSVREPTSGILDAGATRVRLLAAGSKKEVQPSERRS